MTINYLLSGDRSILIQFDNSISSEINHKVLQLRNIILQKKIDGIIEMIPAYRSLKIDYNPLKISPQELILHIQKLHQKINTAPLMTKKIIEIPTLYTGPDLNAVATYNHLSVEEVISRHSSRDYLIYMLGFTPGFPYLGGMDDTIATPRLKKPRTKLPAGSVGIAENQTGIYPLDSPGGWRIIGKTPVKLFDPARDTPFLLSTGDYIKFISITREEFQEIKKHVEQNTYKIKSYLKDVK